jgi:uncharacterized DUF497 family protein
MMKLEFEWDGAKAEANLQAHGVSFDPAKSALSSSAWLPVGWRCL